MVIPTIDIGHAILQIAIVSFYVVLMFWIFGWFRFTILYEGEEEPTTDAAAAAGRNNITAVSNSTLPNVTDPIGYGSESDYDYPPRIVARKMKKYKKYRQKIKNELQINPYFYCRTKKKKEQKERPQYSASNASAIGISTEDITTDSEAVMTCSITKTLSSSYDDDNDNEYKKMAFIHDCGDSSSNTRTDNNKIDNNSSSSNSNNNNETESRADLEMGSMSAGTTTKIIATVKEKNMLLLEEGEIANVDRDTTTNIDHSCCLICMEEYRIGDHIASSNNHNCSHTFHAACIIEWLAKLKQKRMPTSCPVCRQNYLRRSA